MFSIQLYILNNYYVLQACQSSKDEGEIDISIPPKKIKKRTAKQSTTAKQSSNDAVLQEYEEVGSPKTTPASADFLVCYATAYG